MIAKLTGKLIEKSPASVIIEISGIGFEVLITGKTFEKLPDTGGTISLNIHTYVREDEIKLIGFSDIEEKDTFLKLLSVSGISVKIALSSLSIYSASELKKIILKRDVELIRRIPGIGKKLAERMILEIQDKLGEPDISGDFQLSGNGEIMSEVRQALKTLGYSTPEINEAFRKVKREDIQDNKTENVLKLVLKEM
jgi:holliday junction DNA helicase RuvA